ncbi:MAG: dihydrodipicolinate synthase family protein [Clostridia bacterium]|jgi:4-hydroxy-tetrahydrodipicolinate synthase|nr:dihydrodipicolinate synthase family protein [Clostridia bacterium]MBT7121705.1 dihydrodipicolinate synthase family protein [Clostridia bacterium]
MNNKFNYAEKVQMAKKALTGPIASVSVPFLRDGQIDYDSLRSSVDFDVEHGSGTILLTYGDSLYSILTDKEITEISRVVVEQTAGRAMTCVAGRWWMGECIRFAQYAYELGADMYMALPPNWANSATAAGIAEFYTQISKEIPTMVVTSLDPAPVPFESIKMLLEGDNGVVALKDDKCGVYGKQVATLLDGAWGFLSGGRKINHLEQHPYKIDGYLSCYMRFCPQIAHRYWDAIVADDIRAATKIIQDYDMPYFDELIPKTGLDFDAVIHASMEIFGVSQRWRRIPYASATDAQMDIIRSFFVDKKLL